MASTPILSPSSPLIKSLSRNSLCKDSEDAVPSPDLVRAARNLVEKATSSWLGLPQLQEIPKLRDSIVKRDGKTMGGAPSALVSSAKVGRALQSLAEANTAEEFYEEIYVLAEVIDTWMAEKDGDLESLRRCRDKGTFDGLVFDPIPVIESSFASLLLLCECMQSFLAQLELVKRDDESALVRLNRAICSLRGDSSDMQENATLDVTLNKSAGLRRPPSSSPTKRPMRVKKRRVCKPVSQAEEDDVPHVGRFANLKRSSDKVISGRLRHRAAAKATDL